MTTFLLIRHAETDAVGKRIMGWRSGWHLNSKGRQQVERLARALEKAPIHAIYTSPLERALETAEPIAQRHGLAAQALDELGEMRLGEWEGRTLNELDELEQFRRFNAYRSGARAPGGDLMLETQARIVGRVEGLTLQHPDQTVALVSHGDPLRALVLHHLGMPLDHVLRLEISPASVSVLEAGAWGSRLLCLNQTGEFPL